MQQACTSCAHMMHGLGAKLNTNQSSTSLKTKLLSLECAKDAKHPWWDNDLSRL
jgi:hypothetical protein